MPDSQRTPGIWDAVQSLLDKLHILLILLGASMGFLAATGGVRAGGVDLSIHEGYARVGVAVSAAVLLAAGLLSAISLGARSELEAIREDVQTLLRRVGAEPAVLDSSFRAHFDAVNQKLDGAVKSILNEVRRQQRTFAKTIEERFDEQSAEATKMLQEALNKELLTAVKTASERDQIAVRFGELMFQALHQMGVFQRVNLEKQSGESLFSVEKQIGTAIGAVAQEVNDLKATVSQLALPGR